MLPLMGGVLSPLIIVLVVGVAVIFAWRKKQNNKGTKHEGKKKKSFLLTLLTAIFIAVKWDFALFIITQNNFSFYCF